MGHSDFRANNISPQAASFQKWRNLVRAIVLVCGFLQVCSARFYIEPDGVNYLDIAREYLRHDWKHAINAYWSPLLSWLLALAIRITGANSYWKIPLLHLLNFGIFCVSLWCFEFFFKALISKQRQNLDFEKRGTGISEWAWWLLGYTLFTYSSLFLTPVNLDTPDILVNAFVFAASGFVLHFGASASKWKAPLLLGAVLGAAYLAKTVMFPLGFVFVVAAYIAGLRSVLGRKQAIARALLAGAIFLAISLSWITALTSSEHRDTFGDSGRIAYWMYSHDVTSVFHWHGEFPDGGFPVHPIQKIFPRPAVDSFTDPIGGSYPPLYKPSYWYRGAEAHFSLKGQLAVFHQTLPVYFRIFSAEKELLAGFLVLLFFSANWRHYFRDLAHLLQVWAPSLAGMILYSLVYMESRYVGGFIVVFWCCLFAAIRLRPQSISRRVTNAVILAICAVMAIGIARATVVYLIESFHPQPNTQWEVGAALNKMGLQQGDTVAVIGSSNVGNYWAHSGGIRIVSDIQADSIGPFWLASQDTKNLVYDAFRRTGARAIVTYTEPDPDVAAGWKKIGATGYSVYFLDPKFENGASP